MEQKPVDITLQTVLMFIPIVSIFAFYRIERLSQGIFLFFIGLAISMVIQLFAPFPYGLIFAYVPLFAVPLCFIRNWSRRWNARFEAENV